jgi:hypothetical protein
MARKVAVRECNLILCQVAAAGVFISASELFRHALAFSLKIRICRDLRAEFSYRPGLLIDPFKTMLLCRGHTFITSKQRREYGRGYTHSVCALLFRRRIPRSQPLVCTRHQLSAFRSAETLQKVVRSLRSNANLYRSLGILCEGTPRCAFFAPSHRAHQIGHFYFVIHPGHTYLYVYVCVKRGRARVLLFDAATIKSLLTGSNLFAVKGFEVF